MELNGNLIKLSTLLKKKGENNIATYYLRLNEEVCLNEMIGKTVTINYTSEINCIKCGRKTKTSFAQGYCYPCFKEAPETEECVLKPELCRAHEGIARDMEFAKGHCLKDHYVYLAVSSGLKVGVTRQSQVPTRWIDQGAVQAIKLAKTPNRFLAGQIEVALKDYMADKTNWRNMLKNNIDTSIDLLEEKGKAEDLLPRDLAEYISPDDDIQEIDYPVAKYPVKIKSLSLDKIKSYSGVLSGIKGQYMIFEDDTVFNVRKHNGYKVVIDFQ